MVSVFAHGELRLYLLVLLGEAPRHGYDLMTALSDRFGGTYKPSAGTVYPRLARLEEEGLVRRTEAGRTAPYTLTDAGRAELDARSDEVARLEAGIDATVRERAESLRADVASSMDGLRAELALAAQDARTRRRDADGSREGGGARAARAGSYSARREVEAMVQAFRDDLRAELRRADARDAVTRLTVETARTVLDAARSSIRATLR
ncbi:PadR family transcriptional regulator [Luteimicrobium subarcticum]|uniref:PadR family transcriptional regulator n=1 Tax=Luteimicrobium subarcticum TaxID=620910 RepID=A0A2M8WWD0_9MICO|nr:PadR family transcriptional regulator [Luteimicrobium subarcticum]PJI95225.1 PadR family transcriptional regulator [Luteimicrobium subarcticum]